MKTFANWSEDNVPRLAAAFSFYAVLSLAPLLVLAVAGASYLLGEQGARDDLLRHVRGELGRENEELGKAAAEFLDTLLKKAQKPTAGLTATILSLIVTFFGASNLFLQLDDAVNTIWGIKQTGSMIRAVLLSRITAFLAVLFFGSVVLAWLALDSWIGWLVRHAGGFPGLQYLSILTTVLVFIGAFGVSLKKLPRNRVAWRDVWPGAIVAAVGVALGKFLLSYYFALAGVLNAYGPAGALVVILLWIYYTSQIYFFGVEMTYTYALEYGSLKNQPAPGLQYS